MMSFQSNSANTASSRHPRIHVECTTVHQSKGTAGTSTIATSPRHNSPRHTSKASVTSPRSGKTFQKDRRNHHRLLIYAVILLSTLAGWFSHDNKMLETYPVLRADTRKMFTPVESSSGDVGAVSAVGAVGDNVYVSIEPATVNTSILLAMVPIDPYQACKWRINKIACTVTILLQQVGNIPLLQVNDPTIQQRFCDDLVSMAGNSTEIVYVPVCIQNFTTLGLLAYYQKVSSGNAHEEITGSSSIQMVQDKDELAVTQYMKANSHLKQRMVHLKKIDFPSYYRRSITGWEYERLRDSNFGNMVWRYASTMILNAATNVFQTDDSDSWAEVDTNREVDALVIATANTLHLSEEPLLQELIEEMTRRVMVRNVPTVVLGLGIQSEFDENVTDADTSKLELPHEYQKNLLMEISKHQDLPAIGVRGDLTASVCKNSGINNCLALGCPSLTISRDLNLGGTLKKNWDKLRLKLVQKSKKKKIRIAVAVPAFPDKLNQAVMTTLELLASLFELYPGQVKIILQYENDAARIGEYIENEYRTLYPQTNLTNASVVFEEYYNVESWLLAARTNYDVCVSARIHGSMVFISSAIPTIAIPTDYRIQELIHAMKIPHIMPTGLNKILTSYKTDQSSTKDLLLSLMDNTQNTDFIEFEINRRNKIRAWKSLLEDSGAGLEMDPQLVHIISTPLKGVPTSTKTTIRTSSSNGATTRNSRQ